MAAMVLAVCKSHKRTEPKQNHHEGFFEAGSGLRGDAHFGTEKEISLLAQEDAEVFKHNAGIDASYGCFAENLRTEGIDLMSLPIGTQLNVGEAVVEIIEKGKDPALAHTYSYKGHSLLPTRGVFARVIQSGNVKVGDSISIVS